MKKYTHGIIEGAGPAVTYRGVGFVSGEHSRIPSDWELHDYRVLQFQGVTLVNIEEAPAVETSTETDTFVRMHGAYVEQPEKLAESLGRTLGRRGRK